MKTISNPHDKYFKSALSDKSNAVEFFSNYLPQNILGFMNFDTLKITKDSFVSRELKEYFSDILYTVDLAGSEGYIYILLEHKSFNDTLPMFQLLKYILRIWELHIKQTQDKQLPIILPVMLYHGKEKFRSGTQLSACIKGPVKELYPFIPDFEMLLYDLSEYADDELKGTAILKIVLMMLKHIFNHDFPDKFEEILKLLKDVIESESGLESFEPLIRYVFNVRDDMTAEDLKNMVGKYMSAEKEDIIMTLAEKLRQEGIQEGRQEGYRAMLLEAVQAKFNHVEKSIEQKINGIDSTEFLASLLKDIFRIDSLDEFEKLIENC